MLHTVNHAVSLECHMSCIFCVEKVFIFFDAKSNQFIFSPQNECFTIFSKSLLFSFLYCSQFNIASSMLSVLFAYLLYDYAFLLPKEDSLKKQGFGYSIWLHYLQKAALPVNLDIRLSKLAMATAKHCYCAHFSKFAKRGPFSSYT